jgi:hypothetical protein
VALRRYKPVKKAAKSIREGGDTQEKRYIPVPVLRAELQIPQAITDRYDANQHEQNAWKWWEWRLSVVTAVLGVVGFVILFFTLRATQQATDAARSSADTAAATLKMDQRAWVGLRALDVLNKPTAGEALKIHAEVENSGKSPALHVIPAGLLAPVRTVPGETRVPFQDRNELAECRGPKPRWSDVVGGALLFPHTEKAGIDKTSPPLHAALVQAMTNGGQPAPVSEQDLHDIPALEESPGTQNWMVNLYFVGCLNYFDVFHEAHRTSFCLFYTQTGISPNGQFAACPEGNDGD